MLTQIILVVLTLFMKCDSVNNEEIEKLCGTQPCLTKCCPNNSHMLFRKCINTTNEDYNFDDLPVYNDDNIKTGAKVQDVFKIAEAAHFGFEIDADDVIFVNFENDSIFNTYLRKDGKLYLEKPNEFYRWIVRNNQFYCVDYELPDPEINDTTARLGFWVATKDLVPSDLNDTNDGWSYFITISLCLSCLFLLAVLVVYGLLPELRNLCGMIFMAYAASLLCAYSLLALMRILLMYDDMEYTDCLFFSYSIYFTLLSSFFWMNVMSWDIWWTFRGYAKARPIHRRGVNFKFMMYAIYAWGVPLTMTIGMWIIYNADLRHIPWFIKPNIECFFSDGEKLLYLYIPMLIILLTNWLFFILTAYNVWRVGRNTAVLDTAAAGNRAEHRSHKNRFMVYLKLSAVMGISWVLEVVSFFTPTLKLWHISDAYHSLIGLAMFLIFVCKKNILTKLTKRFQKTSLNFSSRYRTSSSTSESELISQQEAVCSNPKGTLLYKPR